MKLTMLPERLREALDVAGRAAMKSAVLPSVANVLLDATADGGLTVTGTDLDARAWLTVPARVDQPGRVSLPPKALDDFLAVCADGDELTLAVGEQHRATLTCGRARVKLAGLDPDEFPVLPELGTAAEVTIPASLLKQVIDATAFAAAGDRSRPVLSGVLVQIQYGTLTLAAADGFRLAVRKAAVETAVELTIVVPAVYLERVASALGAAEGDVHLAVDAGRATLRITSDVGTWQVKLIDGQFPDFTRIIPRELKARVTVDRSRLRAAAGLVKAFVKTVDDNGTWHIARLEVTPETLTVRTGGNAADNEGVMELDCSLDGDPMEVAFNATYLRDATAALDGDQVLLELSGPASPAVLRNPAAPDAAVHVLMPMHIARPGT